MRPMCLSLRCAGVRVCPTSSPASLFVRPCCSSPASSSPSAWPKLSSSTRLDRAVSPPVGQVRSSPDRVRSEATPRESKIKLHQPERLNRLPLFWLPDHIQQKTYFISFSACISPDKANPCFPSVIQKVFFFFMTVVLFSG